MADATDRSLRDLRTLQGIAVTYCSGTLRIPLTAVPARTVVEGSDQSGAVTTARLRDWLLAAEDLVDDTDLLTPASGDWIEHAIGSRTVTYQVTRPTLEEPPYREIDPAGTWLRIHSQKV